MGAYCVTCGKKQTSTGSMFSECYTCWNQHRTLDETVLDSEKDAYVIHINQTKREYTILTYDIEELDRTLRKAGKGQQFYIKGLGKLVVTQLSWVYFKSVYSKKFYCDLVK